MTGPGASVTLEGVTKRYAPGAPPALDRLTIEARPGEFLFLLGPSGSGKTTVLRLIGGYERPDAGEVRFDGQLVNAVPAHHRHVGMVFQSYALFPHLTVAQNVSFGLRMRATPRAERDQAVAWALNLVRLTGLESRYPRELSGGQQQRVAVARAVAYRPPVLLLDEPLANLDRRLRDEMRLELKALQRQLGTTTVFVTHDQDEALALADRIAVLDHGKLEALSTPHELYSRPQTAFVASFMGQMNLVTGELCVSAPGDGRRMAHVLGAALEVSAPEGACAGDRVTVCLRAESLGLASPQDERASGVSWEGAILLATYHGADTLYLVQLQDGPVLRVVESNGLNAPRWQTGETVAVEWRGPPPHVLRGAVSGVSMSAFASHHATAHSS